MKNELALSGPILDFTASKDYLSGKSQAMELTEKTSFTIELSFITTERGYRQGMLGVVDQPPVRSQFQVMVFLESDGAPCFEICAWKSYCRRVSTAPVSPGKWHNLKAHYEASSGTISLEVDSQSSAKKAPVTSNAPSDGTFRLGTDFHSNFNGQIKDFTITRL